MQAHLVLLETVGNQDFVFATNKLRQNIGASELIHRIGTSFVLSAVAEEAEAYREFADKVALAYRVKEDKDGKKSYAGAAVPTADYVRDLARIAESNRLGAGTSVEVVVATSGKAVLLVDEPATGKRIIERVTLRALREAPGAVVRGIVDEKELGDTRDVAHARMKAIHENLNALRRDLPAPEARFPNLPIVAPCATSGLPAEHRKDNEYLSAPAHCKREQAEPGWLRVKAAVGDVGEWLAKDVARLDDMKLSWYGVVHADGNGFGKVFLELDHCMPDEAGKTARDYCDFYRNLSLALDMAGVLALRNAVDALRKAIETEGIEDDPNNNKYLPVVPLVFGGDDLTMICDGSRAVTFAETYLKEFEQATRVEMIGRFKSVIPALLDPKTRIKRDGFGGAAGIAVIKPHHPFHRAYDLAEALTKKAKKTKIHLSTDAVSALDFQVVYQDAASDLEKLRRPWTRDGSIRLDARPYIVSGDDRIGCARQNRDWAERHRIFALKQAMRALRGTGDEESNEERAALPRSQQHALRRALFADVADERLALIRSRYKKVDWATFGEGAASLFFTDVDGTRRTRFLDALELIDIGESSGDGGSAAPTYQREAAE